MSLNIKVKHAPSHYYGHDCYWVPAEPKHGWNTVSWWMRDNGVKYQLHSTSKHGHRFSVSSKLEWFMLRWL